MAELVGDASDSTGDDRNTGGNRFQHHQGGAFSEFVLGVVEVGLVEA